MTRTQRTDIPVFVPIPLSARQSRDILPGKLQAAGGKRGYRKFPDSPFPTNPGAWRRMSASSSCKITKTGISRPNSHCIMRPMRSASAAASRFLAGKDYVSAVQPSLNLQKSSRFKAFLQLRHRHFVFAADVDAPQQSDMPLHPVHLASHFLQSGPQQPICWVVCFIAASANLHQSNFFV